MELEALMKEEDKQEARGDVNMEGEKIEKQKWSYSDWDRWDWDE